MSDRKPEWIGVIAPDPGPTTPTPWNDPPPLTREQAAIVSAYTGYLAGDFASMHEYVERKLGHPVWTHEFPALWKRGEIQSACKADFVAIVYKDPTAGR